MGVLIINKIPTNWVYIRATVFWKLPYIARLRLDPYVVGFVLGSGECTSSQGNEMSIGCQKYEHGSMSSPISTALSASISIYSICVRIFLYVFISVSHVSAQTHICMYTYMYIYLLKYIHVYKYVYIYMYVYIYVYIYMYI